MTPIETIQNEYIKIEQEIAKLWPLAFSRACAACTSVCCRQHMVDDLLQSPWLATITTRVHGAKWHQQKTAAPCVALTPKGCMLTAGKPPFCFQFYCDKMLEGVPPYELVAHLYLSFILPGLCRLDKHTNLLELTLAQMEERKERVLQRIENARRQLALYRQFLDTPPSEQPRLTVQMLAEAPQILSKSVCKVLLSGAPSAQKQP